MKVHPKYRYKYRYFHYSIFLFFLSFFSLGYSQNLIPDGGFELEATNGCVSPEQGFKKLQYWYLLDATPDLFEQECSFDENGFFFWHENTQAYEGRNYAGLWSRWNSNASYFTEGIATSLSEPLEAGKTYFFEMAILNQGTFSGLISGSAGCVLEPIQHIDLYIDYDSIKVINDFGNGTASTTSPLVASFEMDLISNASSEIWTTISTCFEANGGEDFFALIMPLGTFGELPPCATTQQGSGIFRSFYFNIDATFLTELPEILEAELQACDGEAFEIDLLDMFDLSILEQATILWPDGIEGASRILSETGNYSIEAIVSCKTVPIELNILPEDCQSNIYVPNVFSPNSDGINDIFQAFISNSQTISNFEFLIFDRWGATIFKSGDPNIGWDGTIKGELATRGIYTWSVRYEIVTLEETRQVMEFGDVLLLR